MAMGIDVLKVMVLAAGGGNKAKAFNSRSSQGVPPCSRGSFD